MIHKINTAKGILEGIKNLDNERFVVGGRICSKERTQLSISNHPEIIFYGEVHEILKGEDISFREDYFRGEYFEETSQVLNHNRGELKANMIKYKESNL